MRHCRFVWLLLLAVPAQSRAEEPNWNAAKREHWAWQAPVRPALPTVRDAAWPRNPIDAFILARLEAANLRPATPASREQLLRRVTFDLVGLPPTPEEIDAFVKDASPDAWEKVIDRLLASPHYGERWGRHWLDLARYADSNGYEHDEVRPDAWRYRDYVIVAFNADKPYDRFLKEQLAGDELAPDDPAALIATGFNLLGPDMPDASSQQQRRQNTLDDMTDTAGLVFLGLTVGCARCHNHKYEPISIADYYRLQAFFAPAEFRRDLPVADRARKAAHDKQLQAFHDLTRPARTALQTLEEPYRKKLVEARVAKLAEAARVAHRTPAERRTPEQRELVASTTRFLTVSPKALDEALTPGDRAERHRLLNELKKLEARKPLPLPTATGLHETGKPARTFVLRRGELHNRDEEVQPGYLTALTNFEPRPAPVAASPRSTGRRTALADWLTRPDHPLTARVLVNRLWQHHFGRGLVATPSDFGLRGARPTHPELLDWLATEFVARGWSVKQMHKLMLLSATYQQSSQASPATLRHDPANDLFGRMNRQRLEGEIVRDSLLAVSGRLNPRMGGPGVLPPLPPDAGISAKDWKVSPDPADHVRRGVYLFARRNLRFPFLEPFDLPDSNQSCPQRERSTTAPQALALLNASEIAAAAQALAARLEREAATDEERVTRAYRLTLGRSPTDAERSLAREFLRESPLRELCRALFNVNEYVYVD